MDRRRTPRSRVRLDVLACSGAEEGAGVLAEISHAGARVEDCSLRPAVGTPLRLYLYLPDGPPFELEGTVERHTETGFALRTEAHDAALRSLVDALRERLAPRRAG